MRPTTLATACEAGRLPAAYVLAQTFLAHHAGANALVLVTDDRARELWPAPPAGVEALPAEDFLGAQVAMLAAALEGPELVAALAPLVLSRVGAPAVFLTADGEVLSPIELPDTGLVVAAGGAPGSVCDDGFAAVPTSSAADALTWWREQAEGLTLGERPLDAATSRFESVALVRNPAWAVAPWNAADRELRADPEGRLFVNGERPVVWLRHGALPAPSNGDPRAGAAAQALAQADLRYQERVALAGDSPAGGTPQYTTLANGTPLDARLRALFAEGVRTGALAQPPFDADGQRAFGVFLNDPHPDPAAGGVSRYLHALWAGRPDLRVAYADLRDPDARAGFLGWVSAYAEHEAGVAPWLLPSGSAPATADVDPTLPLAVNVAGYFQSELGIGEIARRALDALDAVHIPALPVQGVGAPPSRRGADAPSVAPQAAAFGFNLVCVNADGLPRFLAEAGPSFTTGRYTIGMWWWELPDFPERYHGAFDLVDEVWVGSQYVHDAIQAVAPVPVLQMPMPVVAPPVVPRTRAELALPEGFVFLFAFDFNSVFERKNPLGLIEAFNQAFPAGSGVSLVLKCVNGEQHPYDHKRLRAAVDAQTDVHLIDGYVTAEARDAMVASADAYVSLHRSEGLGLTLAEAMALGKPVIATGLGGNTDFMDETTGWLVPYDLVEVGPGNEPYDAGSRWAAPDLAAAAAAMREVIARPDEAARRGARAAARIANDHSFEASGAAMRARLEVLHPRMVDRAATVGAPLSSTTALALAPARDVVAHGPGAATGGLRGVLRRTLLRVMRPITVPQHEIDRQLLDAMQRTTDEIARDAAAVRTGHASLAAAALERQRRLVTRVAVLERDAARARAELDAAAPFVAGARARPWVDGDPFGVYEHPVAGRVLGYQTSTAQDPVDAYRTFEDSFRGSRERVAGLLAPYVDLLRGNSPVLDVGAGRGELLELLGAAGIEARGVDLDAGMARGGRDAGLDISVGDGVVALEQAPAGSLGAVTAIHVIEHLPYEVLQRFFTAARVALRPGGVLVCETINPHAPASMKTFWTDPTHQHPLFPEVALVLARAAGFPAAFVGHLRGAGDVDVDRYAADAYTLVAEAASP